MTVPTPQYSGKVSKKFWARIAAVKDEPTHTLLYVAALALQEHESRVLQLFKEIERHKREKQ